MSVSFPKPAQEQNAGQGPGDGVQSEASTGVDKYLNTPEGVNIKTGWSKSTRYTSKSNAA